jgi:hypothetical protein
MSGGSVPFAIPWRRSLSRAKVPAEDPLDLAQLIYQQYPVVYGTHLSMTVVSVFRGPETVSLNWWGTQIGGGNFPPL